MEYVVFEELIGKVKDLLQWCDIDELCFNFVIVSDCTKKIQWAYDVKMEVMMKVLLAIPSCKTCKEYLQHTTKTFNGLLENREFIQSIYMFHDQLTDRRISPGGEEYLEAKQRFESNR